MEIYNEEVALLVGQGGLLNGQRWAVKSEIVIGRDPACTIVVADRQVSRNHARLKLTPRGITLEDLGSKNGTHWNGKPIYQEVILQDGDVIQIALAQQFVFLSSDATVPLDISALDILDFPITDTEREQPLKAEDRRLQLDSRSRRVWIRVANEEGVPDSQDTSNIDIEIIPPLSINQFHLLEQLFYNQDKVVPRYQLITSVWGEEQAIDVSEQALDALVRRLRERLALVDNSHEYIITVRGHGLRLNNPPFFNKE